MISSTDPVYVVRYYDIYDSEHTEFILGVASSREHAIEIIKFQLEATGGFWNYRFSIEKFLLNERYGGLTTETIPKEQNIEWAKELGVYDGNNN